MGLANLFQTRAVRLREDSQSRAVSRPSGWPSGLVTFTDSGGLWGSDYQGGMSLPGAWRASILLSDLIGQLPFHAYRDRSGVQTKLDTPLLLSKPNPGETAINTWSSLALDLLWHGNAFALIAERDSNGVPTSLFPTSADIVEVRWNKGEIEYRVGNTPYAAYDVLHIKGPSRPGELRGMGVLENHIENTLKLSADLERQARTVGSHGVPTGILKSTDPAFDEEDARDLKTAWATSQSTRTIAILNATTDFMPLGWNPEETQLLEARKFSLHEIALIFGLDPSWLGVTGASMTYANIEQESINLIKYSLSGHLTRFEQALSDLLPRGTWVRAKSVFEKRRRVCVTTPLA